MCHSSIMQEFSSCVYMEQPVSLGHDGKIKHNNRVTLNHSETKERFLIKISAKTILGNESVSWNKDNISHVLLPLVAKNLFWLRSAAWICSPLDGESSDCSVQRLTSHILNIVFLGIQKSLFSFFMEIRSNENKHEKRISLKVNNNKTNVVWANTSRWKDGPGPALTWYLTAVHLEAQCDSRLPGNRAYAQVASQRGLWQHRPGNLLRVGVALENLTSSTETKNANYLVFQSRRVSVGLCDQVCDLLGFQSKQKNAAGCEYMIRATFVRGETVFFCSFL